MGFLVSLIVGWGVPPKAAKVVLLAALVGLVIALFFGAKAIYDHSIIANHDAKIEASAAKADRKADQKAADQKTIDEQRTAQEADQLQKAVDNAAHDPKVADAVEQRHAFYRCLSLQQRARANSLKPPVCV